MSKITPWCSVIIPTLNEEKNLASAIASLRGEWKEGELEIIVVDGGSTDHTLEVARSQDARIVEVPAGRARQLNAGAKVASGEYLYFLHADTLAPPQLPLHLRAAARKGFPACCPLRFDQQADSLWLRLFSTLSRWNVDAFRFGDQSLFVHRTDFKLVNGYRENHLLLEGHDLVRRLRRATGGLTIMAGAVTTSARRYRGHGVVFTQLVFMTIYTLYRLGVPQWMLVAVYRRAFPAT